jgi:hypothetical protein
MIFYKKIYFITDHRTQMLLVGNMEKELNKGEVIIQRTAQLKKMKMV